MKSLLVLGLVACGLSTLRAADVARSDTEIWNEGVRHYLAGDMTNALTVLKPLVLTKEYGARVAEVVAKIEWDKARAPSAAAAQDGGAAQLEGLESAAFAAQIALRAHPGDARVQRNFTRATDALPQVRENARIAKILRGAQGQDPGSILKQSVDSARAVMIEAGSYRTNAAAAAVAAADRLSAAAERLADSWLPVRETIAQSVTNQEQAATILAQLDQAETRTKQAARELGALADDAYASMSGVEHDFTRFFKLTALPPAALGEDILAQTNAWQDVEPFNGRAWQQDALDYTRAFRAKFPAWARAYEQQAQADTNKPPFKPEDQAKISALATELEKLQMECCEKNLPPSQQKALGLLQQIESLMPKDKNGGGGQQNPQQNPQQNKKDDKKKDQNQDQQQPPENQNQQEQPKPEEEKKDEDKKDSEQQQEPSQEEQNLEATLKKAQERNDEHEAEKKARMRKAPLPPNERDW